MNHSDNFKERLKTIMARESNRSFAARCDISEMTLRRYLSGATFPPLDTLEKIAVASGCSLAWLASGEGGMRRMITLESLYGPNLAAKAAELAVNEEKGVGVGVEYSPEVAELAMLLENYANKALKANLKAKLLQMKEMSEGGY